MLPQTGIPYVEWRQCTRLRVECKALRGEQNETQRGVAQRRPPAQRHVCSMDTMGRPCYTGGTQVAPFRSSLRTLALGPVRVRVRSLKEC